MRFGWAPPWTSLGRLQRSPRSLARFERATSRRGGNGKVDRKGGGWSFTLSCFWANKLMMIIIMMKGRERRGEERKRLDFPPCKHSCEPHGRVHFSKTELGCVYAYFLYIQYLVQTFCCSPFYILTYSTGHSSMPIIYKFVCPLRTTTLCIV